jgi:hypothetical protein
MYSPNLKQTPVHFYPSDPPPVAEIITPVDWGRDGKQTGAPPQTIKQSPGLGSTLSTFFKKFKGEGQTGEGLISSLFPDGIFRFDRLQKDDLILLGLIFLLLYDDYDIELLLALGFIFITGL